MFSSDQDNTSSTVFIDLMSAIALIFLLVLSVMVILLQRNIILAAQYEIEVEDARLKIINLDSTIAVLSKEKIDLEYLLKSRPKRIIIPNELEEKVFFNTGSAVIRREFYKILNTYANYIKGELNSGSFNHVQIEGHTDIVPISQECMRDNWDLGAARAIAVAKYFINKGISAKYFSASTYSQYHPLDPRNIEDARKRNRRIEIVLQKR